MEDILKYVSASLQKFQSVTTIAEARMVLTELITELCILLAERAETNSESFDAELGRAIKRRTDNFWLCTTLKRMYIVLALACVFQNTWVLFLLYPILLDKILQVLLRWIVYTLDDSELHRNIRFIRGWLGLFLREGEDLMHDAAAWKFAAAYSAVANAQTGVSVARFIVRHKMTAIRLEFIRELGAGRFEHSSPAYIKEMEQEVSQTSAALNEGGKSLCAVKNEQTEEPKKMM